MLSTLILKSEALVSRFPRINNNAHADMHNAHQHGCGNIHIHEHLLHNLVLGERNLPDFRFPKQASINAFLLCPPVLRQ